MTAPEGGARERGAGSLSVHGVEGERRAGSPVVPPISQSATFHWADPGDGDLPYTRYANNPSQLAVSSKLAALEGTEAAVVLSSGMAAVAMTLLSLTESGAHVLASKPLYGATQGLLRTELPKRGIEATLLDPHEGRWRNELRPETKLLYLEMPTNPTLRLFDPGPLVELAHARGIPVVCDATFASPINWSPASMGIDVVVHSATKYLAGHADVIAGVVAGSAELVSEVTMLSRLYGPALDPHAAWLLDRGMRSLEVRMHRHNQNGEVVARALEAHPAVERVIYPGLPSHPDHAVAKQLLRGFGGIVGVVLRGGGRAADRFVSSLQLAVAAPSLGSVQTLVSQPRYTSHAALSPEQREAQGIPDGFVRISVGIENAEDLVADFEQALASSESA
jgi:cystathionine beta-lyase/cystathionine gamma-synthase